MSTEIFLGNKIPLLHDNFRVEPLKDLSKLKLTSFIGNRLAHLIILVLDLPEIKVSFWCDSIMALWWIREGEKSWKVGSERVKFCFKQGKRDFSFGPTEI
ncbi:hypothetical protein CEXT_769751 [Caerostris extrusa]|uniref:Uncharacterized protein n=1 Tax=Caerostris extrusa TaxID=172846 RepID=A0AAV4UGG4_CAEEX|nr:hypothetical protein CEXT_769751 [Caerostris extrusa]